MKNTKYYILIFLCALPMVALADGANPNIKSNYTMLVEAWDKAPSAKFSDVDGEWVNGRCLIDPQSGIISLAANSSLLVSTLDVSKTSNGYEYSHKFAQVREPGPGTHSVSDYFDDRTKADVLDELADVGELRQLAFEGFNGNGAKEQNGSLFMSHSRGARLELRKGAIQGGQNNKEYLLLKLTYEDDGTSWQPISYYCYYFQELK